MYYTIYNQDKAKRLPHSTFDVERSMFNVQVVASEITTKPSYHVEITYTGQEFLICYFPDKSGFMSEAHKSSSLQSVYPI